MKAAMAPAMKNAGTRQVTTWSVRYAKRVSQPNKREPIIGSVVMFPPWTGRNIDHPKVSPIQVCSENSADPLQKSCIFHPTW